MALILIPNLRNIVIEYCWFREQEIIDNQDEFGFLLRNIWVKNPSEIHPKNYKYITKVEYYDYITEEVLQKFHNLTKLNCGYTKITNNGVKNLHNLTALSCNYTKITDDGIKDLHNLTKLCCGRTKITDNGIKNLHNLTYLDCSNTKITDNGIKNLKNLTDLCYDDCQNITKNGTKHIINFYITIYK